LWPAIGPSKVWPRTLVAGLKKPSGGASGPGWKPAVGLFDIDKVVGRQLLDGNLPASNTVLAVSGRAGYEVVQKAIAAGIPMLVSVGAPSSLAVRTALAFDLTLVGFLKHDRFNVYSGPERLSSD